MTIDWHAGLKKVKRAIDTIQSHPVLDELTSDALQLVPIGGPILVKYWNKYKNSKDSDPLKEVLHTLDTMSRMNENKLESFCTMLENNSAHILENNKFLKKIVSQQSEILDELNSTKNEIKIVGDRVVSNTQTLERVELSNAHILESVETIATIINKWVDPTHNPMIDEKAENNGSQINDEEKYQKISQCYDIILESDLHNIPLWLGKSKTLVKLDDYENALSIVHLVLEIEPENSDALLGAGTILNYQNKCRDALKYLDHLLEIEPENIPGLFNKGYALGFLEKRDEALIYFDKSLKLYPEYALALAWKGAALGGLDRLDEASVCIDAAQKLDPDNGTIKWLKIALLLKLGKDEEAEKLAKG